MTVCMCHRQDISHNDNLSQPADTPDMEYERHTETLCASPLCFTHAMHTIAYDLPLPRSLSLLHGVLINKFINGLLIMSAYLLLKHRHCPPDSNLILATNTHTHTHIICTYLYPHTLYIHNLCVSLLPTLKSS